MCPKRPPRNAKNKRGRSADKPVELGKEYEVDITEINPDGEGLARIKDYLIFIRGAKVGEHLTVRITKVGSMNADAQISA